MIRINLPWDNAERLGSKVIGYVKDQASLVSQIQANIKSLQTTLLNLNDKIKDRMNNELQDVIYDGQDILEEFGVLAYRAHSKPIGWVYLIKQIALRINSLKDTVESLPDQDNFRNQRPPGENNQPNLTTSHVLPDPFQSVGMHRQKQEIENLLASQRPGPNIIATVGMGGVGKSRLLQHVFHESTIHPKIWLSVPQTFSVEQLQREIAGRIWHGLTLLRHVRYPFKFGSRESFFNEFNEGGEVTRKNKMTELLEVFPSLIVFDNVWPAEERLLEGIGLFGTNSKCKILISTRNRNVLRLMRVHRVEIAPLSQIDSRTLFSRHAFTNYQFPEELEQVGHCIVDECKRIPLALEETGREMANLENRVNIWIAKLKEIKRVGVQGNTLSKLKLSFDSMPNHVKHLFLYWSFFHKEDRNIDSEYLLSLWEAENRLSIGDAVGVASRPRENLMNFLEELYNACLIEKEEHIEKEKNFCIMQDLLRDLCIHISKENNWVFDVDGINPLAANRHCRRLSLPKMNLQISSFPARRCSPALRALSLSGNVRITDIDISFFSNMKVLRVLDVSGTSITCLPEYMKEMKLLRVLNMSGCTQIRKLPECVKHLKSLELLDISGCTLLKKLPKWIGRKLEWLRHLNILDTNISFPYSHLPRKLLILRGVNERPWELEDAEHFENLQEVHLVLRGNNATRVQDALFASKPEIKVLSLKPHRNDHLVLSANISMMRGLEKLNIERFEIQDRIANFESLQFLHLNGCMYENFPSLQNMNSLRKLELANDNSCRELPGGFGIGFPNLEWLKISNFTALEILPELEDGRLKKCHHLYVENCSQFWSIPGRWEYLLPERN